MSEFTFLFRGRKSSGAPEEMQRHFEKWVKWFKDLTSDGYMKETGHPLEGAGKLVKGKEKVIIDGSYAEAKDIVNGYSVIDARDLDQAAELAAGCPILEVGGSVEIRPNQILNM